MSKQLNLSLDNEVYDVIAAIAFRRGMTKKALITEWALKDSLNGDQLSPLEQQRMEAEGLRAIHEQALSIIEKHYLEAFTAYEPREKTELNRKWNEKEEECITQLFLKHGVSGQQGSAELIAAIEELMRENIVTQDNWSIMSMLEKLTEYHAVVSMKAVKETLK